MPLADQQGMNLTHVIRTADKLAKRMGGVFTPDARVATRSESGTYIAKVETRPLSR